MADGNVTRVRVCVACGEVLSSMDTLCPRCQRHGTLQDRYQCLRCRQIMDTANCELCAERTGVRETAAAPVPSPRSLESLEPVPDLAKGEVPAWLAGCVGGALFGAATGAIAAGFFGESFVVGGLIGLVPGALAGAFLAGPSR